MSSQEQDFAEIIRLLKQISDKLDKPCSCGPKDGTQSFPAPYLNPIIGPSPCPVCHSQGINNYACPRSDCPTAIRVNPIWNAIANGSVSVANGTPSAGFLTGLTVVSNT